MFNTILLVRTFAGVTYIVQVTYKDQRNPTLLSI